jgi:hypothetical protein
MRPLTFDRSTKIWLISSILVLLVSIGVYTFRSHFDERVVLLVVVLTPVVLMVLALVFGLFTQKI